MTIPSIDWNKVFEFAWRILTFIVGVGIIIVVSTNWTRWEGGARWQTSNDAYLRHCGRIQLALVSRSGTPSCTRPS